MEKLLQEDKQYLINVYNRMPFAIESAEGHYLKDAKGNQYLDLFCGVGVTAVGHRHPVILSAIQSQSEKFLHISNNFANQGAISYAKALLERTVGKGKVFFGNSGTEASESAIKLVHKWAKSKGENHRGILVLTDSYHGRTTAAMQLTRQKNVHQDFPLTTMPFYEIAHNDIEALKETIRSHRPHAVMIETVLGAGGIYPLSASFMQAVQFLCQQNDILLIVDEVQTGFGRTGSFFSYEQTPLQPDVVVFGKACGGGLPLSGIITNEKTSHLFQAGDHGTTFGPNPLSIAAGHAMFNILTETDVMENTRNVSAYLHSQLMELQEKHPSLISDVRGKGMMFGISLNMTPTEAKGLQTDLIDKGILVDVTKKTVIRLLPPLSLTYVEAEHVIHTLHQTLTSFTQKQKTTLG